MTIDQNEADDDSASGTASACNLLALAPTARAEHIALAKSLLFVEGQVVHELPGGLSFELPSSSFGEVARFIENERRCCAHRNFVISVPPREQALELRITGTGVREGLSALVFASAPALIAPERA